MSRRISLISTFAALLAGTALAPSNAFANEAAAAAAPAAPSIRVVAAERRELVETLSVTGTIVPREEAAAGTDLNGLAVIRLNADQGDTVKKGQVLAVLDRSSLDTQLAQIDASRAQAEASIEQVRAQIADAEVGVRQAGEAWQRSDKLKGMGVATQAELDNSVNAQDSAKAKLDMAVKALAASEAQLGVIDAQKENVLLQIAKTEVRSPADGLVLARDATLGGVVSSSGGPLFRVAIGGAFELAARIPETSLPRLIKDMKAVVAVAGSEHEIVGSIRLIAPEVDQKSRLGAIRIALPAGSVVRAGNFARGEVETARGKSVSVPTSAVVFKGRDAFLQRVDSGKIKTVQVKLGVRADGFVEVVSGLGEGDEVVSRAGTFVADGDIVTPIRSEITGAVKP